jgi:hypothetical protein
MGTISGGKGNIGSKDVVLFEPEPDIFIGSAKGAAVVGTSDRYLQDD